MSLPKLPFPTIVFLLIAGAALTAALLHVKPVEKERSTAPVPILPAGELPVFEVDDAHNLLAHPGDSNVPKYVMAPASGFILDVSHYPVSNFRLPPGAVAPNVIWVGSRDESFTIPWQADQTRYEISTRTAHPEVSVIPFQANSSRELHIFIGYRSPASAFTPSITSLGWMGTVSIVRP